MAKTQVVQVNSLKVAFVATLSDVATPAGSVYGRSASGVVVTSQLSALTGVHDDFVLVWFEETCISIVSVFSSVQVRAGADLVVWITSDTIDTARDLVLKNNLDVDVVLSPFYVGNTAATAAEFQDSPMKLIQRSVFSVHPPCQAVFVSAWGGCLHWFGTHSEPMANPWCWPALRSGAAPTSST